MTISRKKHSTATKVKVVLEVLKGEKTGAEITAKYGIHATQINNWKVELKRLRRNNNN